MPQVEHSKAAQASAAALLRLGDRTAKELQDDTDDAINRASAALASKGDSARRRDAFSAILASATKLSGAIAGGLMLMQSNAAGLAQRRVVAEFEAIGLTISPHEVPSAALLFGNDQQAAWNLAASESLASTWRATALARVQQAIRADKSIGQALTASKRAIASSVERTAITEVTRTYADTHRQTIVDIVRHNARAREWVEANDVQRIWVALLDACEDCIDLDGTTTDLEGSFLGGAEPPLHPRCRCQASLISNVSFRKAH